MPALISSSHPNRAQKWLVITGVFVLILAAVFAVLATLIPAVRVGFIPAAAVLSLAGICLLVLGRRVRAKAAAVRRVLETGIAGKGTIVTMAQTGLIVNLAPQVRMTLSVEVPGRPTYQADLKVIVPLLLVGRLTSGVPLPVKVNRADPSNVVIDWDASVPAVQGDPAND